MVRWSIHLAVRDAGGLPRRTFLGTYPQDQLPEALRDALLRAARVGAGIQVAADRAKPGIYPGRRP